MTQLYRKSNEELVEELVSNVGAMEMSTDSFDNWQCIAVENLLLHRINQLERTVVRLERNLVYS